MNYKITCAYDGTRYHGWQKQPALPTVQGEIERAFSAVLSSHGETINIAANGCGRTDGGVHALAYVLSVALPQNKTLPPKSLLTALNNKLPPDIAITACEQTSDDFHARFCAVGKEYTYRVRQGGIRNPFEATRVLHYPYKTALDTAKMNAAAKLLIGEHDFASYCAAEAVKRLDSTVRTVYDCTVTQNDGVAEITVSGNGFLYNMVRIIAGTLIEVSEGKRGKRDIIDSLNNPDRSKAGRTLPPHGLYLNKVYY